MAIEVLLVEDSEADAALVEESLEDSKLKVNLHIVQDGVEAVNFLNKQGDYQDVDTPDIIILDLNLPRKDGREVLEEIKGDEHLKRIPVVVLTTSSAEEDIYRSYKLHANCYITKPLDFDQFSRIVASIEDFWFTIVKLPPRGE
ncbi:response regulator [Tunicatimonas pelagia]|uniref:response regulator n=1 Tax=Tunicatimonas pelagia TaxID=931531 RepID=UPI0026657D2A|nr:response regulator [Tunicatimonas pelagia]WKN40417.1 response regulator [Tunicatimonas pelagia]